MSRVIKINTSKKDEWEFLSKEEDMSCVLKNKQTEEILEGYILSITSNGIYTIGIK